MNPDLKSTVQKMNLQPYNHTLFANMACFADLVWEIDLSTEMISVMLDRYHTEYTAQEYPYSVIFESYCEKMADERNRDIFEQHLHITALRVLKKTESMEVLLTSSGYPVSIFHFEMTPFMEGEHTVSVYVCARNIQAEKNISFNGMIQRKMENDFYLQQNANFEIDNLTGLYTKEAFFRYAVNKINEEQTAYDLICIQVTSLKMINERYGIKIGDILLHRMAEKLQNRLTNQALCGRLSGDKLVLLLPKTTLEKHRERIAACLNEWDDFPLSDVAFKVGVYPDVNGDLEMQVMCDCAMLAIDSIRNNYGEIIGIYNEEIHEKHHLEQEILTSMKQALRDEQFQVYYQPKHNIITGEVRSAEALVRWVHPTLGLLTPNQFIPLFEQNGFIYQLDIYVLNHVCRLMQDWLNRGLQPIPVSVNISKSDLCVQNLDEIISDIVDSYHLSHDLIHLEMTETFYCEDPQWATLLVDRFRNKGFCIELDDFGSGYSSMSALSELTIDVLKLDRNLIWHISDKKYKIVIEAALLLAKGFGTDVVAEGVETLDQLEELKKLVQHKLGEQNEVLIQGFYFSEPLPKAAFEEYLPESVKFISIKDAYLL